MQLAALGQSTELILTSITLIDDDAIATLQCYYGAAAAAVFASIGIFVDTDDRVGTAHCAAYPIDSW